ncbi:antirestriction protein [Escherichia coli]
MFPAFFLPVPGQSTKEVAAGSALPGHAGHGLVGFQLCGLSVVCGLAQKMMPEYQGGFWHFIRLPDGGGYMMPDGDHFHLVNGENWFDRTVSADAAGIILTSLVINRQLWLHHDSGNAGLTHLYRIRDAQLWSHIEFHPECNATYAALD